MIGKLFPEKNRNLFRIVLIFVLMIAMVLLMTACAAPAEEAPVEKVEEAPAEAPEEEHEEASEEMVEEEQEEMADSATLAIEHFSVIEGTTWSGAHDRACGSPSSGAPAISRAAGAAGRKSAYCRFPQLRF